MARPEADRALSANSEQIAVLVLAVLAGIAGGAGLVRLWTASIGVDQAWGLYAAAQMLHGVELNGPRLVEVNPPFIFWFMAVPAWAAEHLHLAPIAAFRLFEIGLLALLGAWASRLYIRTREFSRFSLCAFVLAITYFGCFTMSAADLGEREHFLSFFILPYLVVAVLRLERVSFAGWVRVLVGLAAAVALCLKPQHILDLGAVELLLLLRLRKVREWLDWSTVTCAAGVLAYLLAVRFTNPTYFTELVPLLKATYWGFDQPWPAVVQPARRMIVLFLLALVWYFSGRKKLRLERFEAVLIAASLGALVAFIQQHKGWAYQMIPFRFFVYLLLTLLAADTFACVQERRSRWSRGDRTAISVRYRLQSLAAVSVVLSLVVFSVRNPFAEVQADDPGQVLGTIYGPLPAGAKVDFLSMDAWAFPAIVAQDKVWSSRYMHLWMLPAIIKSQDPADPAARKHLARADAEGIAKTVRAAVTEDLAAYQPAIIVVDPCGRIHLCPAFAREGFGDTLGWFLVDPAFRGEWSHYRYVRNEGKFAVYRRQM